MKTDDFDFELPDELIAQKPADIRSDARLLVYSRNTGMIIDSNVLHITDFIDDSYHLVFNNSKVIPCRMKIKKADSNREGELLVLKIIDSTTIHSLTDSNKKYKTGQRIVLPDGTIAIIKANIDDISKVIVSEKPVFNVDFFNTYGSIPLPPYIKKIPDSTDNERYQTTFSKKYGSAAAPTAGLHFDDKIFNILHDKKIDVSFVSLHVGLGTFQPIYSDTIENHQIHEEEYEIDKEEAFALNQAILNKKKIIPIGTTSLRTIESAYTNKGIFPGVQKTKLYITPGYQLKISSGLFTNFHTPKSSLAVLVASIIGYDNFIRIYKHAIENKYRFFSYGDAMLIL